MGLVEKAIISITKLKMKKSFNPGDVKEVSSEGLREYRDVPYNNRLGKELLMDIFEPVVEEGTELPVIVNIHGGGLIGGNKNLSVGFCRQLAKRGYLVFSLEYRLIPAIRVYEQFDDVCAGMDCIGKKLVDFDVDFTRIYMVAESAGAYLATYVAAMKKSEALQKAIGYQPTNMVFKAMGLISGMFYTTRKDMLGYFLSRSIYGKDARSIAMAEYTNPEHPEIIYNIPPCYLITSKADMLERYTLDFAGELGNKGIEHYLRHMGSDPKLLHAFPVLNSSLPESERVIDEIVGWFEKHTLLTEKQ
jgi:acetyl esterase/lipase